MEMSNINTYKKNQIFDLLQSMEEAVRISKEHLSKSNIHECPFSTFNLIIESFVSINNSLNESIDNERVKVTDNLANTIVEMIEVAKNNNLKDFTNLFKNKMIENFIQWRNKIYKTIKFNILVYGINNMYFIITELLDVDKVEILAFIDDSNENVGKTINGKLIVDINTLNYNYDYVLLTAGNYETLNRSILKGILDSNKIIDFYRYYITYFDYNFYKKYFDFIESSKKFEGTITGLSYQEVGIIPQYLDNKFYNFAVSSQDIFYDYEIMKYMLTFKKMKENVKYAIIGLSYYSFQYDMSRSSRKIRTNCYGTIFHNMHNYDCAEESTLFYKKFIDSIKYIFCESFTRKIYSLIKEPTEKYLEGIFNTKFDSKKLKYDSTRELKQSVEMDFNKDYPVTVIENIEILKKYLQLLKENDIKPILVVCPQNKFYCKYSSEKMKNDFLNIINKLKNVYSFQFIDYFSSDEFKDSDFYDISHLNYKGAEKFTKILDKIIEW